MWDLDNLKILFFEGFVFFLIQSNVIEASPDMRRESEKEWYFGNAEKERLGPYNFDEVCSCMETDNLYHI